MRASLADGSGDEPTSTMPKVIAFVPRDAPGLQLVDDWDGMGQRTTASGSVVLDGVRVPADNVVPFSRIFYEPDYAPLGGSSDGHHSALATEPVPASLRHHFADLKPVRFKRGVAR